jgi:hypothetical protein
MSAAGLELHLVDETGRLQPMAKLKFYSKGICNPRLEG